MSLNMKEQRDVVKIVEEMKKQKSVVYAEIGVDVGATVLEVAEKLDENDKMYLFDFEKTVKDVCNKVLEKNKVQVIGLANTGKSGDTYGWNLAKLVLEQREKEEDGIFDVVYLDGAHTFIHDGIACCLCKELLKKGGVIIFDDINWSLAKSPTCNPTVNPEIKNSYTEEQINTHQVKMVVDLFMKEDKEFEYVKPIFHEAEGRIAIYRKI